ncbi:MAG: hemolysin family protein [Chlamydiales bacterium]|nr:hemolysin family protein [Chlamydiales bacterium]
MLILFLCSLLGSFALTCTYNSLRTLREQKSTLFLNEIGHIFFYRSFHALVVKKNEFYSLFFVALIARYLLLFIASASLIAYFLLDSTLSFSPQHENWFIGWLVLFISSLATLLFGEFVPRIYSSLFPYKALKLSAAISSFSLFITFPITYLFLKLPKKFSKAISLEGLHGSTIQVTESIIDMLENADITAAIGIHNKKLIEAVLNFKDRIVREVMVPRVNVFSLPSSLSIKSAAERLLQEGYSRIPVYKDTIDSIAGILMYKDILTYYVKCQAGELSETHLDLPIETLIKPVFYTPETRLVSHLLQEFRNKQMHLAIVVDEYGGTEGIVSIEDILEEIVGDIADEYDEEEVILYTEQAANDWIVDARMSILDIEENFDINIPQDGDYDTIGGYIYHKAGLIPQKGFHIYQDDFEIEVLSSSDRSVDKVRITKNPNIHFRR